MARSRSNKKGTTHVSEAERRGIVNDLLLLSCDGILGVGPKKRVAAKWDRSKATVTHVSAQYLGSVDAGVVDGDCSPQMKGRVGRKRMDCDELIARIRAVPMQDRQTKTRLAAAASISRHLLTPLMKEGALRRVTDRIKPSLTKENELARLTHVLSHIDDTTLMYDGGYDVIHVDEKWFNEDKDNQSYLLLDGEEPALLKKGELPISIVCDRNRSAFESASATLAEAGRCMLF